MNHRCVGAVQSATSWDRAETKDKCVCLPPDPRDTLFSTLHQCQTPSLVAFELQDLRVHPSGFSGFGLRIIPPACLVAEAFGVELKPKSSIPGSLASG